jgi:hypothetical protein
LFGPVCPNINSVNHKSRAYLVIGLLAVICGGAAWGIAFYRARRMQPAWLLRRLPTSNALVVYLDVAALRRAGILGVFEDQNVSEDADYRDFVRRTNFDYKQDLDTAVAAFAPAGKFLLLRGRFNWKSLRSYVVSENGACYNALCRMPGSTPQRRISFFPLESNWMALAVADDESAALRMQDPASGPEREIPNAPIWLSIPTSLLQSADNLPASTRPFAASLEHAHSVILSFAPDGKRLAARLEVGCANNQDAATLASQLSRTTALLRQLIEHEHHTPNPGELSGVLTSGSFRNEGTRVFGYWPIERAFLENLFAGGSS